MARYIGHPGTMLRLEMCSNTQRTKKSTHRDLLENLREEQRLICEQDCSPPNTALLEGKREPST